MFNRDTQNIERSIREFSAPITQLFDLRHEHIHRHTHEPTKLVVESPDAEKLSRGLCHLGSSLQSDQVQIAMDLLQGWRRSGDASLYSDLEMCARFPTALRTSWRSEAAIRQNIIEMQCHTPLGEDNGYQIVPDTTSLTLRRIEGKNGLPQKVTADIVWGLGDGSATRDELAQRWSEAVAFLKGTSGVDLPTQFRVPKFKGATVVDREVPIDSGISLHFRPVGPGFAERSLIAPPERRTAWTADVAHRDLHKLFHHLDLPLLANSTNWIRELSAYLNTLATPTEYALNKSAEICDVQRGISAISFSTEQFFGWNDSFRPFGQVEIEFRCFSYKLAMTIDQREPRDSNVVKIDCVNESIGRRMSDQLLSICHRQLETRLHSLMPLRSDRN